MVNKFGVLHIGLFRLSSIHKVMEANIDEFEFSEHTYYKPKVSTFTAFNVHHNLLHVALVVVPDKYRFINLGAINSETSHVKRMMIKTVKKAYQERYQRLLLESI